MLTRLASRFADARFEGLLVETGNRFAVDDKERCPGIGNVGRQRVVFFQVLDAAKAAYEVSDLYTDIMALSTTNLRSARWQSQSAAHGVSRAP